MNIGEFRQAVRELRQALTRQEDEEIVSLITQLSALLQDLSAEAPVYPELMVEVRWLLDQFWAWVVNRVARENWHQGEEVKPWLRLQLLLSDAGLLVKDYHQPAIYRSLAKQYLAFNQAQLNLDENALLAYTIESFRQDFATLKDNSYSAALAFAAAVREQITCLTEKEINLVQDALYTFCLHVYEDERRRDKYPSPFPFSGKTKCNAAEKKRQALAGFPIKYGLLETIALKQGRLGALVDMFERAL